MKFERKINKTGSSLSVYIPIDLAKYFNIEEGSIVELEDDEDKIIIRKKES